MLRVLPRTAQQMGQYVEHLANQLAATADDRLASAIDIAPTCLALLGIDAQLAFPHSGVDLMARARPCVFSQNFTANQPDNRQLGICKAFAATGLRVGWAVGPADVVARMSAILGHVGAWAPRAEQVATVGLLDDGAGIAKYHENFRKAVQAGAKLASIGTWGLRGSSSAARWPSAIASSNRP